MKHIFFLTVLLIASVAISDDKLKINTPFPNFTLKRLDGNGQVSLAQYKGKAVIIDFWASWCAPCKKEIPEINKLYLKYKSKGLEVLGVNIDDEKGTAVAFVKEQNAAMVKAKSGKIAFTLVYDAGKKLANQCKLSSMPSSFVIDKNGVIKFIHSGFNEGDGAQFEKEIKSLL